MWSHIWKSDTELTLPPNQPHNTPPSLPTPLSEHHHTLDVLFRWLAHEKDAAELTQDRKDTEVAEYTRIPNTRALAERVRSCLQEHDPLPRDFQVRIMKWVVGLGLEGIKHRGIQQRGGEERTLILTRMVATKV